ncbi:DUF5691 domain-containing protein [Chitinimonas viridis]|uniref:DUF5691 domain-containing protein n=1 Tax=Chitinimonas viridis TaxID=664880 RepID=A0ABT8B0K7_9NEIS|nr:DUF5691 domain-containing protein [Chitinimonas viridis]MDN3575191.1 DUF5691 domain-containing protein [Chitinimonas viridis]
MNELTRLALVGTANLPMDVASNDAVTALLPAGSREQRLLWQAGGEAVMATAGYQPARATLPRQAPLDAQPVLPAVLWSSLSSLLDKTQHELAPWVVQRMQQTGYRLPEALLPAVLSQAKQRQLWWPVIGERGRWLAAHNPDWAAPEVLALDTLGDAALLRLWEEGDLKLRCRVLAEQRRRDPVAARSLLLAALPKEKADARLALIQALEQGLSLDDADTLESLLADKSATVRQGIGELLSRLPDSAYCERQWQRIAPYMQWVPVDGGQGETVLQVSLPPEFDKAWERDGLKETELLKAKRSWWLTQLLMRVPPSRWCQQAGLPAAALLPQIEAHEWGRELLCSLMEAALRFKDAEWAELLLFQDRRKMYPLFMQWHERLVAVIPTERLDELLPVLNGTQGLDDIVAVWRQRSVPMTSARLNQVLDVFVETEARSGLAYRLSMFDWMALSAEDASMPALLAYCQHLQQKGLEGTTSFHPYHLEQLDRIVLLLQAKQTFIKEMPL